MYPIGFVAFLTVMAYVLIGQFLLRMWASRNPDSPWSKALGICL